MRGSGACAIAAPRAEPVIRREAGSDSAGQVGGESHTGLAIARRRHGSTALRREACQESNRTFQGLTYREPVRSIQTDLT